LAAIKSVVTQLKSKKITSITLSSFADEKSGVNFKSVAQTRADVVASMIKKANPKIKITYRLFGSSTKKNSLSLGRVVITA
jgi:NMD protein affecting ribosome stability and mRNA decay